MNPTEQPEEKDLFVSIPSSKDIIFTESGEPEEKETQEELEDRVQITLSMNLGTFERVVKALKTDPEIWEEVKEELTRLSKEFENL